MNDLIAIEYQGQRILTTAQLAESYGADAQLIVNNFNRNKERYTEGKHFILLEGAALKEFRAINQIDLPPNVNKLYLWPEKGAWLHAKSLNTDKAWEAYEILVDDYYRLLETGVTKSKPRKPSIPSWERAAIGEIRFAKEFAKATGIRTERAIAIALAEIEHQTGRILTSYRLTLPAIEPEEAEIFTATQIGEKINKTANVVNLMLEELNLQEGKREPGKKEGSQRLVNHNPWRLTEKGKGYGIMQDSAKQTGNSKWEGFQIYWKPKVVDMLLSHLDKVLTTV